MNRTGTTLWSVRGEAEGGEAGGRWGCEKGGQNERFQETDAGQESDVQSWGVTEREA